MSIQPIQGVSSPTSGPLGTPPLKDAPATPGIATLAQRALVLVAAVESRVIQDTLEIRGRPEKRRSVQDASKDEVMARRRARKALREEAAARRAVRRKQRQAAALDQAKGGPRLVYSAGELSAMARAARRLNIQG